MEKKSKWICDCGKEYDQPAGDVKFPIREKCDCGKELYKLTEPDGIVTEFVKAEDWFIKEFDEYEEKMVKTKGMYAQHVDVFFKAFDNIAEFRIKIKEQHKKMKNIVEHGARRTRDNKGETLHRRKNMQWSFLRGFKKWAGRPKAEVKK
jgi:hypothetical protein